MNTEGIVYLLRKTNLSRKEIGELKPIQFNEILKELYYQESIDEWRKMHTVASILAAIYNTIPRKAGRGACKAGDFLSGKMPQRAGKKQDTLEELARDKGIRLPTKEIKER